MFKILLILLIIAFSCILSSARQKIQFPIGAIFNGPDDESEIAFRSAIDRFNMHERAFDFAPIIKYAAMDDSFTAEKIVCDLVTQDVVAIFGPSSIKAAGIVSSICKALEIPHFLYQWLPDESVFEKEERTMTLNLYPEGLMLAGAYADIVAGMSWKSYTILFDSDYDIMQLQDVLQLQSPGSIPIGLRRLGDGPDYRPLLKEIKASGEHIFILHCPIEKIIDVLRQANELRMFGEYESFFIPLLDTHTIDFEELANTMSNMTTVRIMDPTSFDVKNLVHDWEESQKRLGKNFRVSPDRVTTNMVLVNDAVWTLAKGLKHLDLYEEIELPNKLQCRKAKPWPFGKRIVEQIKARIDDGATGRIEFNEYGQRTFFNVRILEYGPPEFHDIANWNPVERLGGASDQDENYAKKIEEKLHNKTFTVVSRIGAPFLSMREPKEGEILEGNARFEGYSLDLIDAIAQILGSSYRFVLTPDGKYGGYNPATKQWDGLVRQLLDGKGDIAICDLTITSSRRQVVDFTSPFMSLGISILFLKSIPAPPDLFSFLSPFSFEVWVYMGSALLLISLLLYALARMCPDDWENPHPCDPNPEEVENIWDVKNSTWLTIGSLMGQGCDLLPKAASTRLVTGMWWFFALMMLNSYTANLAAFLTKSMQDDNIGSAEDLATQSKIKYGAVRGGSTMGFFKDSNFSLYQRMWAAMESARPSVFTKNNDEAVDRVLKGKRLYAFLMESTMIEYLSERNCDLEQVGGLLDYKSYGIALPFNSPYRKAINAAILKLGESGKLIELKRKWWKEKGGGGKCAAGPTEQADTAELAMENVGGVFLVLGAGLFTAVIIGLLEFLWNVKDVALEEKISLKEAFMLEITFALKFWITEKPVHGSSGSGGSDTQSKKSSKSEKSSKSGGSKLSVKSSKSDLNLKSSPENRDRSESESNSSNIMKNIGWPIGGFGFAKKRSNANNVESPL